MKKLLAVFLVLTVGIFIASYSVAMQAGYTGETSATAGDGIVGSVHDISFSGNHHQSNGNYESDPQDYLKRICIFCHAPHHTKHVNGRVLNDGSGANNTGSAGHGADPIEADIRHTYLPLWNHQFTERPDFEQYTNGSGPLGGTAQKAAQSISAFEEVGSVSLLCLGCHDGSRAVNTYGNPAQDSRSMSNDTDSADIINAQYRIGYAANDTDNGILENHHPIGFRYADVVAVDLEIYDPAGVTLGTHTLSDLLYDGKMECATCHAVHNTGNNGEKLLYESDSHSNLCLSCHAKGLTQ
jgi:predicted CXXCH cytochrome family protein